MKKELKIEKVACDFCGSENSTRFDQLEEWKIVKCTDCGFVFTNPRPTVESLPHFYSEDYYKDERHYSKFYNDNGSLRIGNEDQ